MIHRDELLCIDKVDLISWIQGFEEIKKVLQNSMT